MCKEKIHWGLLYHLWYVYNCTCSPGVCQPHRLLPFTQIQLQWRILSVFNTFSSISCDSLIMWRYLDSSFWIPIMWVTKPLFLILIQLFFFSIFVHFLALNSTLVTVDWEEAFSFVTASIFCLNLTIPKTNYFLHFSLGFKYHLI